jgi:hypothetical protein
MLGASSNAVFRDCTVTCSQLNGANPDSLILNSTVNGVRYYVGSNGNLSGSVTFAGATSASVTFPVAESDANYRIVLGSSANKVFWWSSKSTSGFTLNASASSTDTIDWMLVR